MKNKILTGRKKHYKQSSSQNHGFSSKSTMISSNNNQSTFLIQNKSITPREHLKLSMRSFSLKKSVKSNESPMISHHKKEKSSALKKVIQQSGKTNLKFKSAKKVSSNLDRSCHLSRSNFINS